MANIFEWFTRGKRAFHGIALALDEDGRESFERVDAAQLGADDFRMSGSMRLADRWAADFSETLPAYSYKATLSRVAAVRRSIA